MRLQLLLVKWLTKDTKIDSAARPEYGEGLRIIDKITSHGINIFPLHINRVMGGFSYIELVISITILALLL